MGGLSLQYAFKTSDNVLAIAVMSFAMSTVIVNHILGPAPRAGYQKITTPARFVSARATDPSIKHNHLSAAVSSDHVVIKASSWIRFARRLRGRRDNAIATAP